MKDVVSPHGDIENKPMNGPAERIVQPVRKPDQLAEIDVEAPEYAVGREDERMTHKPQRPVGTGFHRQGQDRCTAPERAHPSAFQSPERPSFHGIGCACLVQPYDRTLIYPVEKPAAKYCQRGDRFVAEATIENTIPLA